MVTQPSSVLQLARNGILDAREAEDLASMAVFPRSFEDRVLSRWGRARMVRDYPGIETDIVIEAEPNEPVEPSTLAYRGPLPEGFDTSCMRFCAVRLHVARAGRLFVGPKHTTLVLDDANYFAEPSGSNSHWVAAAFGGLAADIHLSGTAAILHSNFGARGGVTQFSHWLFDVLPKIEVLRRSGWEPERIDHFIVTSQVQGFEREGFGRLGIPEEKLVFENGRLLSADCFLIPSKVRNFVQSPRWVREFIRRTFLGDNVKSGLPSARLYISRAKAPRRRLFNDAGVRELLEGQGFRTVFAEELSIAQMAELMSDSRWIFAPHGAGAAHITFAPVGSSLIEAFYAHITPEFWFAASGAGARHFLLAGKDEAGLYPWLDESLAELPAWKKNRMDYYVDLDDLKSAIAMLDSP